MGFLEMGVCLGVEVHIDPRWFVGFDSWVYVSLAELMFRGCFRNLFIGHLSSHSPDGREGTRFLGEAVRTKAV
jgi:hypothetical protein